jgi:hypothetical protein
MTTYRMPDGVLRAEVEGEQVLLNPDTGVYHLVNSTGLRVISLVEVGTSLDDIVEQISEEAGEPETRVRRDVTEFIRGMIERSLLESVDDDPRRSSVHDR